MPVSEEHVDKYKELRLLALKTNPDAFGSKYEDNIGKTAAQWRAMVDTPDRLTVVARMVSTGADDGEWAGTASVLTPQMAGLYTGEAGPNPHLLVGMPRRLLKRLLATGLGKRLIGVGIEWVRARTEGMPEDKRQVTLEVHRDNKPAKALYDGSGFVESADGECEDPKRIPMFVVAK